MLRSRSLVLASAVALGACAQSPSTTAAKTDATSATTQAASNPFLSESTLPFHAPPFDKIKESDYQPAIEEGIRQQLVEIEKIADNPAPPTFENTLVAMERSGTLLNRVMPVFNAVSGANTSPGLQKLQETMAPKLAAYTDAIVLNDKLFARIQTLHEQIDTLPLDAESKRLLDVTYRNFVLGGARLQAGDKLKLKALNSEISTLSSQFTNKLVSAAKNGALVIDDVARLAGMSDGDIAAAAQAATDRGLDGKWVVTLQNTTQQPALQDMSDRETREALFNASWTRAEKGDDNDTRKLIERMAQIRAQQARLLGFPDYASWKLQNQMAKDPQTALAFMRKLAPAAVARARREAADIQNAIARDGGTFKLAAWDWAKYAEQVRKEKYDLDESQIKPYFELDRVLQDGVFYAANHLYGLTFKEREDIPVYQPDVRVFEVFDKDGKPLALFYCDYFKRDNKSGGAWMDNLVNQSRLLGTQPVIYNVANFTKPAPGQPALLSFDDVITMFHEFGHALHGMFADQEYPTLSGTATARDFVEYPSQLNEHWATDPKIFVHYARHYQTGKEMPAELVAKLQKSQLFNKGYDMTELVAAALLDMNWHTITADQPVQDAGIFEAAALERENINLSYVPPRYRSSYFLHIWGNGYAAGYYAYLWTQMLADDSFRWFKEHGGLTRENGQRYRDLILSRGNSQDLAMMYRAFRGEEPSIEPMLEDRGLKEMHGPEHETKQSP
jgi:peptidyl-dipeptidase Dcp